MVQQLVWTPPVLDLSTSSPLPIDDSPPPLIDPFESILFPPTTFSPSPSSTSTSPSSSLPSTPRKPTHSRKKPDDHIPRPPNAFILFRSSFIKGQHVPTEVETNHSTLSKIIGLTWKNLPNDERLFWHAKAKAALDEHKRKFPQYSFRPNQSRGKGDVSGGGGNGGSGGGGGNGGGGGRRHDTSTSLTGEKRKVREVGPKDHKRCLKIAELLVEGKKGQELDEAVQEFDKHHVPEVITRFETPITARMFRRRSSSVPVPPVAVGGKKSKHGGVEEVEEEEQGQRKKRRKVRASSSQPAAPIQVASMPPPQQQLKIETPSVEDFMLPFDSYPLSAASSPSFDFNAFSFDVHSPPHHNAYHHQPIYDPLSPLSPLSPVTSPIDTTPTAALTATTAPPTTATGHHHHLSIDTSFLGLEDCDWSMTTSGTSGTIPSSPLSSCPSSTNTSMPATPCFDLDNLDLYTAFNTHTNANCTNGTTNFDTGASVFEDDILEKSFSSTSTRDLLFGCSHEVLLNPHHHHMASVGQEQGDQNLLFQDATAILGADDLSVFMASIPGYAV